MWLIALSLLEYQSDFLVYDSVEWRCEFSIDLASYPQTGQQSENTYALERATVYITGDP